VVRALGKGKDNIVFIGRKDENNGPVLLDIDSFYGFHFMLPAAYIGVADIDISVEYKIINDGVLAMAWARSINGANNGVRYNVETIKLPPTPQEDIVEQLVKRLNDSADFHSRLMTIYGPDAPGAG